MAQKILLKRSGVSGSIPTTANIDLGELALNTYDGKAFMHKSGSTDEVVQFVVAGSTTSGSINLTGAITASAFKGDGTYLTGVTASMRPDDFDFNTEPFAGSTGFIQGSGSLYKVATTNDQIDFRYNDVTIAKIVTGSGALAGFSGSLYGIGDVLAFSGSVHNRLFNLEISASVGPDGGEI